MGQRFFSPATARSMPWRNGGGSTLEIATGPAGASLEDFAWRASIATVERDGPFSAFPGVERTLVLLGGGGMRLTVGGRDTLLAAPYAAVSFRGEDSAACALLDGPTRDFNFMWRRSAVAAEVRVVTAACALGAADAVLCHAVQDAWICACDGATEALLAAGHTWVVEGAQARRGATIAPGSGAGVAIVASVREARA